MKMKKSSGVVVAALILSGLLLTVRPASADSKHLQGAFPQDGQGVDAKAVTIKLHDLDLLDQNGKRLKFKSDVVKDRLVAIDVIYTTCPVVCPILSAVFANVQKSLGDRLGKEVVLISVSVDPLTDIPPRLNAYAQKWEAKPDWVFLTGDKRNVDRVLQGLGAYAADFTDHPTMVLVGDGARGGWTRFYGFATPEQILGKLDELKAKRQGKVQIGHGAH